MLVSVNEMRSYMGGKEFTPGQQVEMAAVISGIQSDLENYLNRPVEPVQIREVATINAKGFLHLSVTPVWKVISYGGTVAPIDPADSVIPPVQQRDPLLDENGLLIDKWPRSFSQYHIAPGGLQMASYTGNYGYGRNQVAVEYIGGLNGMGIPGLKLAIKRVVAREWASNHIDNAGLRDGQIEQTEIGDGRFLGWSEDELKKYQRHRRRIVLT